MFHRRCEFAALLLLLSAFVAASASAVAPERSTTPLTRAAGEGGDVVVDEEASSPSLLRRGLLNDDDTAAARSRSSTSTKTTTTVGARAAPEASRPRQQQPTLLLRESSSSSSSFPTSRSTVASISPSSSPASSPASPSSSFPSSFFGRQVAATPFQSPFYVPGNKATQDAAAPGADRPPGRQPRAPEVAPGSEDPVRVPGIITPPTFWPAFTDGGYSSEGPLVERLSRATLDTPFRSDYGFDAAVVVYPSAAAATAEDEVASSEDEAASSAAATYPALVWGVGAHNGCNYVDNRQTMEHFASWGFIVICPAVFPEPFPGDEEVIAGAIRYAHDLHFDPSSRFYGKVKVDGIGMVGYSLGGGRVVRALSAIEARAQAAALRSATASYAAAAEVTGRGNPEDDVVEEEEEAAREETRARMQTQTQTQTQTRARTVDAGVADDVGQARTTDAVRSTQRTLLGSDQQRCADSSCEAALCRAAVSLQGWNEGPGSNTSTSLLVLTAEDDDVAGPW